MLSRIFRPAIVFGSILILSDYSSIKKMCAKNEIVFHQFQFPSRNKMISDLKNETYDVLIIGGGATGCGVAHAAASRGLKVGLVERNDFGSGTSSKSTKLIHGGVRYLQKAVTHLDKNEYNLVKESLKERKLLLESCPNMVTPVAIMLPCSSFFDYIFKATGLGLYEIISWDKSMTPKTISKDEIKEKFPFLKTDNIYNGIIYYDGQFDDARMNITVIKTAISLGASACNYIEVRDVKKGNDYQEVILNDKLNDESFTCRAKVIVNATGPYIDKVRKINDNKCQDICRPSSGVHLSMPSNLTRHNIGILINEPNNRVLFVLPWEGTTLIGTSDEPTEISEKPEPCINEVESILRRFSAIVDDQKICDISNVKSCWSGLRPLVIDPNSLKSDTASFSRNHVIEVDGNFISVSGGKWTIFRKMGHDVVDVVQANISNIAQKYDDSLKFELFNTVGWTSEVTEKLINQYKLPEDIAKHLSHSYGVESTDIVLSSKSVTRLHPNYPYTEEEISHICRNEYVFSLQDIIARRTRLSFIDTEVTKHVLDKIALIAKRQLNWSDSRCEVEIKNTLQFIENEMGFKHSLEKSKVENP